MSNIEPTPFGDKYVLVEHIATGGMAEIYRAHYAGIEGFAKELVVKTLREEFAARQEVVGMFLDEARVAATLTHGNVVHTYDLGEIGGEYFIAMELLKGEELVNVMRRSHQLGQPVPVDLAIGIIMQSCEGLHYVHSRVDDQGENLGLVHRDINPTNIHVGYDGACKILDFGIAATRASAVAKKGQVAGKLSYMAPEQLQGRAIDHRADIFPLGVVLYELCVGRRLFRGPHDEVMRRVLEGDIPAPTFVRPEFPPALEAIIMKALEVDPEDRYQNCDHLFRDLEAYLQEEQLSWTPRKLSAMMVELFGEGAPATVNYDDEYDDLDEALDFDKFDNLDHSSDGEEDAAPDWAQRLEARNESAPRRRRRALTIGNLEALVSQPLDETGSNPIVPRVKPDTEPTPSPGSAVGTSEASPTGLARSSVPGEPRPVAPSRSGRHKIVPLPPISENDEPAGSSSKVRGLGPSARKAETGGQLVVPQSRPLPHIAPDGASGRTFGHSVVTEQSKPGAARWVWLIAAVAFVGLAYFAYSLVTSG